MATKSQLKQYFETGKIPTQAQFGELIDFFMPQPSDDAGQRSNQTLKFGQDDEIENPIINGLRTVHYKENDTNIYNFWIFTNYNVNDTGIAVPLFIMFRMSDSNPGIPSSNTKFRYYIPSELEVQSWVSQGIDCDRATDEELWNALQNFQYKDWPEGGGSEFPRVAYIDGQDVWDNWYIQFREANPGNGNSGGSGSPILNEMIIDGYTFIIETSDKINFQGTETLEFLNCTIINNDTTEDAISMNFSGCVFRNCHLDSGYRISNGEFNNCSLLIDGNINNASINDCSLHGGGTSYSCNIRKSDVRVITLEAGNVEYSDIAHCILNDSVSVKGCKLHSCTIYGAKFSSEFTEMIGCSSAFKTAFNGSANEIKGFIFGCDFSGLESIPGVMKGVQCCKFKSTLLSQGIILADIFGNKNASTNGMNTGV
jgi:uncharacterized protein YjbI with pentapeptide repeats